MDWSDHALWWPEKNRWLKRSRSTLDQYGVQADAKLHFTPMHKNLHVQLPDLQILEMRVDYSSDTFNAVMHLCKELGKYWYSTIFQDNELITFFFKISAIPFQHIQSSTSSHGLCACETLKNIKRKIGVQGEP